MRSEWAVEGGSRKNCIGGATRSSRIKGKGGFLIFIIAPKFFKSFIEKE